MKTPGPFPTLPVSAILIALSACSCHREPTGPGESVHQRWLQPSLGYSTARPAVSGNLVIFGTGDGRLVARDIETGAARWTTQVGAGQVAGTNVLVAGGLAIAPTLYVTGAVDVTTGALRWQYEAPLDTTGEAHPLPGYVSGSVIDADSAHVYVPAWGASVSAVNLQTGKADWIWQPADRSTPAGAVGVRADGDVVFTTVWHSLNANVTRSDAWLVALDRHSGRELWRYVPSREVLGVCVSGAPAIWRRLVIFNVCDGYIYAVDRDTHALAWSVAPPIAEDGTFATVVSAPLVVDGTIYVDAGTSHISALRASDGGRIWHALYRTQAKTELAVSDRSVFVPDGKIMTVLDRLTGATRMEVWTPSAENGAFWSPVLTLGGRVFANIDGGHWSFDEL